MNATIIRNWNAVVQPEDVVYVLGDFAFEKDRAKLAGMLEQLKGEKHIIWGNHDGLLKSFPWKQYFKTAADLRTIMVPAESNDGVMQRIVLCHYAFRVWDQSHYGTWHLHGHSHGTLPDDPYMLSTDIGVDSWDFTPVSMKQLNEVMSRKLWKPLAHRTSSSNNEDYGYGI
jgi:calcineurin-like phosphoesterase family protein